jgi:hypothetical protein
MVARRRGGRVGAGHDAPPAARRGRGVVPRAVPQQVTVGFQGANMPSGFDDQSQTCSS